MSVIIKSNNMSTVSLGTIKMLGTTAQAEFDKYKARVLADGGVIKDEPRTLRYFNLLFNVGVYGKLNTCISGTFGVKTNSNGGIEKVYSIDGFDMIGVSHGTGTLPTLTADNAISFAANTPSVYDNGGLLTSAEQHIMTNNGTYGHAIKFAKISTVESKVSGFTKHNDEENTATVAQITGKPEGTQLDLQKDPLSLTVWDNLPALPVNLVKNSNNEYDLVGFLSMPDKGEIYVTLGGTRFGPRVGTTPKELSSTSFYQDLGGAHNSNKIFFTNTTVRDFMSYGSMTREQAALLTVHNW